MPSNHARVSPSGAKKWLVCTKSVQMESLTPDETSPFAREGTIAHEVCENLLKGNPVECEPEMLRYCEAYRDYCVEQSSRLSNPLHYVETKLDLSSYIPEGFGTADYMAIDEKTLILIDFKYGKGVRVSAQRNPQLMLYALGALDLLDYIFDVETVELHIFQPRIDNVDTYTLPVAELRAFGNTARERSRLAYDGLGDCVAGSHCVEGFCRARGRCKAFAEYNLQLEQYGYADRNSLTTQQLGDILQRAETLESWVKSIKDYALALALDGNRIDGMKLVKGRGRRVIEDESTAIGILTANGYTDVTTTKLKGITELERLVGKKRLTELLGNAITLKDGALALAPVTDKRAEYVIDSASLDFANID